MRLMPGPNSLTTCSAGCLKCFDCEQADTKYVLKCLCDQSGWPMCWQCVRRYSTCAQCQHPFEYATDIDCKSSESLSEHDSEHKKAPGTEKEPMRVARLELERARVSHSQAFLQLGGSHFQTKMVTTYRAAAKCVQACEDLPQKDRDDLLFAEALLLCANSLAKVGHGLNLNMTSDAEFDSTTAKSSVFAKARQQAQKAFETMQAAKHPHAPNSMRIMGLIELEHAKCCMPESEKAKGLHRAKQYFLQSILSFRKSELEETVVWSAVAYWDMQLGRICGSLCII